MKRAVIYYSLSGNTEKYARDLAREIHADLIRIRPKKALPDKKWMQLLIGGKQAVFQEKPEIEPLPENIGQYDEIIIGTPVWAGRTASPVHTFLEEKEIAEKVTAVFTLSGSGNNDRCAEELRRQLPGLRCVISLVDMHQERSRENAEKFRELVRNIQDGEEQKN